MSDQRVMVITGTRKGIGKYLAEYYAEQGFQVVGLSRNPIDYELSNYKHFNIDISDESKVKEMFQYINKTFGRLDVLINNAALHTVNFSLLTPSKTVQDIFGVNVLGAFSCCCEAAKLMQKNKFGRIINFSSVAVPLANSGTSVYSASKAAVEQLSKVLGKELAPYGITVNTLGLTVVKESGMIENINENAVKETLAQTAFKSLLEMQDISDALDFLISEKSKMVTCQTIYLGGA